MTQEDEAVRGAVLNHVGGPNITVVKQIASKTKRRLTPARLRGAHTQELTEHSWWHWRAKWSIKSWGTVCNWAVCRRCSGCEWDTRDQSIPPSERPRPARLKDLPLLLLSVSGPISYRSTVRINSEQSCMNKQQIQICTFEKVLLKVLLKKKKRVWKTNCRTMLATCQ